MGGLVGGFNQQAQQLKNFVCGVHLICTCECACWPRSGHYHPSQSCRIPCTHSSHVNGIEAQLCGRGRGRLEACVRTSLACSHSDIFQHNAHLSLYFSLTHSTKTLHQNAPFGRIHARDAYRARSSETDAPARAMLASTSMVWHARPAKGHHKLLRIINP
jgi:hypothetical protein